MARNYLTFGDLDGRLNMLRVECGKCPRKGCYSVAKLIAQHGRDANMADWLADLKGDCPNRYSAAISERCDLRCPDTPKVL